MSEINLTPTRSPDKMTQSFHYYGCDALIWDCAMLAAKYIKIKGLEPFNLAVDSIYAMSVI
jgi:hypothetical protein